MSNLPSARLICDRCGHQSEWSPTDHHPAPVLDRGETPVCPACWRRFVLSGCGVLRPYGWNAPLTDQGMAAAAEKGDDVDAEGRSAMPDLFSMRPWRFAPLRPVAR